MYPFSSTARGDGSKGRSQLPALHCQNRQWHDGSTPILLSPLFRFLMAGGRSTVRSAVRCASGISVRGKRALREPLFVARPPNGRQRCRILSQAAVLSLPISQWCRGNAGGACCCCGTVGSSFKLDPLILPAARFHMRILSILRRGINPHS